MATSMSLRTFTPERARAMIQSTVRMSGMAATMTWVGKPAAESTSGNTIIPASGIPATPAPAIIDAATINN